MCFLPTTGHQRHSREPDPGSRPHRQAARIVVGEAGADVVCEADVGPLRLAQTAQDIDGALGRHRGHLKQARHHATDPAICPQLVKLNLGGRNSCHSLASWLW